MRSTRSSWWPVRDVVMYSSTSDHPVRAALKTLVSPAEARRLARAAAAASR